MKTFLFPLLIYLVCFLAACDKTSDDLVELSVDYTWEGLRSCNWGNPEIRVGGIPKETKFIHLHMFDHVYWHDHGTVEFPYSGESTIQLNRFNEIQGPCPTFTPGKYKITIKALNSDRMVIGEGEKTRYFPE